MPNAFPAGAPKSSDGSHAVPASPAVANAADAAQFPSALAARSQAGPEQAQPDGEPYQPISSTGVPYPSAGPAPGPMSTALAGASNVARTGSPLLDHLSTAPGVAIFQNVEFREMITGFHGKNSYSAVSWTPCDPKRFKQGLGQLICAMKEDSSALSRMCCGPNRGLTITMMPPSNDAADSLVLDKPFRCTTGCFGRPSIHVRHSTLGAVAEVRHPWTLTGTQFKVGKPRGATSGIAPGTAAHAADEWAVMKASGIQMGACCPAVSDFNMPVRDPASGQETGYIKRRRGGFAQGITSSDVFLVNFPTNATPEQKAGLLAAAALLDYTLFEG